MLAWARGLRSRLSGLPWWIWPFLLVLYCFYAAAILLGVGFAFYGVSTTLAWQHVVGHRVRVVVTDCHDWSRAGESCAGIQTDGPGVGDRVTQLPYDPASVGRAETVWAWAGDAVVGTPWSALWFDAVMLATVGYQARRLLSRRGPAPS